MEFYIESDLIENFEEGWKGGGVKKERKSKGNFETSSRNNYFEIIFKLQLGIKKKKKKRN